MLSTEEFKGFAKDYVLFSHITSQVEGAAYPKLLQEKGGRGFPYVVAMDAAGEVVAKLRDRSVEGFRSMMKDAADYAVLLPKKERTPAEALRFLRLEMRLGKVADEEARTRATALEGLDDAGKADRADLLLGLEIKAELNKIQGRDPAPRIAAGKVFAGMWAAGREPQDMEYVQAFFFLMLDHAEDVKDLALFEKALVKVKENFTHIPAGSQFFTRLDERLAKLKEAAPK